MGNEIQGMRALRKQFRIARELARLSKIILAGDPVNIANNWNVKQ